MNPDKAEKGVCTIVSTCGGNNVHEVNVSYTEDYETGAMDQCRFGNEKYRQHKALAAKLMVPIQGVVQLGGWLLESPIQDQLLWYVF